MTYILQEQPPRLHPGVGALGRSGAESYDFDDRVENMIGPRRTAAVAGTATHADAERVDALRPFASNSRFQEGGCSRFQSLRDVEGNLALRT